MVEAINTNTLNLNLTNELNKQSKKIVSTIYNKLFKHHLTEQIKNKKRLIISPDGLLNFLPFEALYHQNKYLIESHEISYISSGRELLRQIKRKNTNLSSNVIVFGSPDFWLKLPKKEPSESLLKNSISIDNATIFDINFSALEISKQEIEIIKKHYSDLEIYQDINATVENLFNIKSPKILHISTHGFFLDNPKNPNPMLASGLAFAGANYASYRDDARGIATALKLSSLELQNTELVVLSACETGLGKIHKAEGVTGLSKAFIQAGAKNVIMSLWSVSSQETVTLMQKFYMNIANGDNYTTALHKAKLQMIKKHPYYWSAFIISGI
ncbi:CHAT domain-containing protein [bacterium]|nr:CHAT domain-containing protein [bacterium]MBU1957404.1 CHAT domain-containing protein [bacterium]